MICNLFPVFCRVHKGAESSVQEKLSSTYIFLHFKRIDFIECKLYINIPDQKIGSPARKKISIMGIACLGFILPRSPSSKNTDFLSENLPTATATPWQTVEQVTATPQPSCGGER